MATARANANKGAVWNIYGGRYGTATGTSVPMGGTIGSTYEVVYGFDMPVLSAGAYNITATLNWYASGGMPTLGGGGSPVNLTPYAVDASWTEGQSSAPHTSSPIGSMPTGTAANGQWITCDISQYVRDYYAGLARYGIAWGIATLQYNGNMYGYDQTNKPYITITYDTNQTPYAPGLVVGATAFPADVGTPITLIFKDPDPNDTLGHWALKRVNGSTTEWWSVAAGGWVLTETWNPGSGTSAVITAAANANKWVNGTTYQLFAATKDAAGLTGPYTSVAVPVKATPRPVPTLLAPANGGTISTASVTAMWTCADQSAYQLRLLSAVDAALEDTGKTSGVATSDTLTTQVENTKTYKVELTCWNSDGVASLPVTNSFSVVFVPPKVPILSTFADVLNVANRLMATIPAPGAGEPVVSYVRFEKSPDEGVTVSEVATVAVSSSKAETTDWASRAGATWYRAVSIGANGTEHAGAWQVEVLRFDYWWFVPLDGANPVRFITSKALSWRPEQDIVVPQTMSVYRRQYRGPTFAALCDIDARYDARDGLTAQEWQDRLLTHCRAGTAGYLKSPHGKVYKGTLTAQSWETDDATGWESAAVSFRQTGVAA